MYIYEEETKFGTIRYACADQGKKILIGEDILVDKVVMSKYATLEDFTEINDADYIPPEEIPEETIDPLETLKKNQIKLSKNNLANYLQDNPILSKCKYEEGKYYNITKEKQDQLTSTLASYIADVLPTIVVGMSTAQVQITSVEEFLLTMDNLPVTLTWNDTGGICEPYTYSQLYQLKCEIFNTVKPLVSVQQHMEVDIKNCTTQEDVLAVDINFTEENINRYLGEVNTNE